MKRIHFISTVLLCAASAVAADDAMDAGRKEEARACIQCHGLRIIHSQRLSKAAWEKELDKMVKWGTVIHDRANLLTYLAAEYSDAKPVPQPPMSADGTAAKTGK